MMLCTYRFHSGPITQDTIKSIFITLMHEAHRKASAYVNYHTHDSQHPHMKKMAKYNLETAQHWAALADRIWHWTYDKPTA